MALLGLGASVVEDKDNAVDKDDNDARLFFPIPNLTGTGVGTTGTNPLLPLVGGASSVYVGLTIAGLSAAVIILAILLAIAVGTDNKGGSGFFGHSGYSGSP